MEDELFVLGKDFLEIGAIWIDPEFCHTSWAMKAAGNEARSLSFPDVAEIDDDDVGSSTMEIASDVSISSMRARAALTISATGVFSLGIVHPALLSFSI